MYPSVRRHLHRRLRNDLYNLCRDFFHLLYFFLYFFHGRGFPPQRYRRAFIEGLFALLFSLTCKFRSHLPTVCTCTQTQATLTLTASIRVISISDTISATHSFTCIPMIPSTAYLFTILTWTLILVFFAIRSVRNDVMTFFGVAWLLDALL